MPRLASLSVIAVVTKWYHYRNRNVLLHSAMRSAVLFAVMMVCMAVSLDGPSILFGAAILALPVNNLNTSSKPTDADLCQDPDRQNDHLGGGGLGLDRERQGQDSGQGGDSTGSAAPDLCGKTA